MSKYLKILFIILAVSSVSSPLFADKLTYTCTLTNAKNSRNWLPSSFTFIKDNGYIKNVSGFYSLRPVGTIKSQSSSSNFNFSWDKTVESVQKNKYNV